jgi:aspartyl-tRNA(Asn)/glutamyl-tRNA(Gln) amidotransferase subunit C
MKEQSIEVPYVAQLARLQLSEEETKRFQEQLVQVLSHVEELGKVDVNSIEPTAHAIPQLNVFRRDEARPSLPVEEAIKNAPQKVNDLFRVPKVVE